MMESSDRALVDAQLEILQRRTEELKNRCLAMMILAARDPAERLLPETKVLRAAATP